ncbi:MAG TPA: nuclear transport factor 2 family protein [Baekduia sp.]|nr:nuclear transport factor 2 family protein [Baekduia sp.]
MPFEYGIPGPKRADVERVRAIYDAFARRDADAAVEHLAPDAELWLTGTAQRVGRTGPYVGHEGMREYLADVNRAWQELELVADDIRAAGDGVVVFGHVRGRVDGTPVARRAVWVWRLRDGQAISVRVTDMGPLDPEG